MGVHYTGIVTWGIWRVGKGTQCVLSPQGQNYKHAWLDMHVLDATSIQIGRRIVQACSPTGLFLSHFIRGVQLFRSTSDFFSFGTCWKKAMTYTRKEFKVLPKLHYVSCAVVVNKCLSFCYIRKIEWRKVRCKFNEGHWPISIKENVDVPQKSFICGFYTR